MNEETTYSSEFSPDAVGYGNECVNTACAQIINKIKVSAMVRFADAFSQILNPCIMILDVATGQFLYASGNFNILCGLGADEVRDMGFSFYSTQILAEDLDVLRRARPLWRQVILDLTPEKRMNYSLHCDFHVLNGQKSHLVHHVFTTIDWGSNDLPRFILCTMSISNKKVCGNIEMRGPRESSYYVLDIVHNTWQKQEAVMLSWQERDVLALSFQGLSVTEIAQIMCKSVDAIKTCKQKMFKRMGVKNIVEAVAYATNYRLT